MTAPHHCHADDCVTEGVCRVCGEVVHDEAAHRCHPVGIDRWLLAHIDEAIRRWGTPRRSEFVPVTPQEDQ